MEAQSRRAQRETERAAVFRSRDVQRWQRELQRRQREIDKEDERIRAADEVERFENYIQLLVTVHKDCGAFWDWNALTRAAPPPPPPRGSQHEFAAGEALRGYRSGFFDRLFGWDRKRTVELQQGVTKGRAADQAEHEEALRQYKAACDTWNLRRTIGARILAGDTSAYGEALDHAAAFGDILSFRTRVSVTASQPDVIALACEVTDGATSRRRKRAHRASALGCKRASRGHGDQRSWAPWDPSAERAMDARSAAVGVRSPRNATGISPPAPSVRFLQCPAREGYWANRCLPVLCHHSSQRRRASSRSRSGRS